MSVDGALAQAWQAALAAEHQAAFGYGLLGPQLRARQQQLAVACSDAHEAVRDATETAMARLGVVPVAPLADYPALYPVAGADAARRLAVRVEEACAAGWRAVFARTAVLTGTVATGLREPAQRQLTASAVRATQWRVLVSPDAATTAFPGV
jgi:hypothetical protein